MAATTGQAHQPSHLPTPPPNTSTCSVPQLDNDIDPWLNHDHIPPTFPKIAATTDFEEYRAALKDVYHSFLRAVYAFLAHPETESSCAKLTKLHQAMTRGLQKWTARRYGLYGVQSTRVEVRAVYGTLLDLSQEELKKARGVMPKMLRMERALCEKMVGKFAAWEKEAVKRHTDRMARLSLELEEIERNEQGMIMQPVGNAIFYLGSREWTTDHVFDASDF